MRLDIISIWMLLFLSAFNFDDFYGGWKVHGAVWNWKHQEKSKLGEYRWLNVMVMQTNLSRMQCNEVIRSIQERERMLSLASCFPEGT